MNEAIYRLSHAWEDDQGREDARDIGIYGTMQLAEAAKLRAMRLPGFSDYPEGFHIGRYVVNADHWASGFFTYQPPTRKNDGQ